MTTDPGEKNNLINHPDYQSVVKEMEDRLYEMLADAGGMDIPMNQPAGRSQNKRWLDKGGRQSADFPKSLVVEEPINKQAK